MSQFELANDDGISQSSGNFISKG